MTNGARDTSVLTRAETKDEVIRKIFGMKFNVYKCLVKIIDSSLSYG